MKVNDQNTPNVTASRTPMLFSIIFMIVGALTSGGMMVFYQAEIKSRLSDLKIQETHAIDLQGQFIEDIFKSIISDLLFISRQNELQEYLASSTPASLDKIALEYVAIAKLNNVYDQIRFIDGNGLETVRINHNQGSPERASKDELQSKRDRYYFRDTYELENGAVFVSPFDLNIEDGIIEQPIKPMIRLGTPVFDSTNQKRGIVLVNYLGGNLLHKLLELESISEGHTMLLNSGGYWMLSPTPGQTWGFMFGDEQRTFGNLHPEVWKEIRAEGSGQINAADGLFTFDTVYPLREGDISSTGSGEAFGESVAVVDHDAYQWHLVSFAPAHIISAYSNRLRVKLFAVGAGMFLLIAAGSWAIALAVTKRRAYQAQLKAMGFYDALTELPNRRLFFDRLSVTLELSRRFKKKFAILYIDLDGFKNVNDSLGHEAGDELLKAVAELLSSVCRKSDTIARLGGDEFAIIIGQLETAEGAEIVAKKIIAALAGSIQLTAGSVQVGASIGIALFPTDSKDAEELVRLADKSMYTSKHRGKNTYTFMCPDTNVQ